MSKALLIRIIAITITITVAAVTGIGYALYNTRQAAAQVEMPVSNNTIAAKDITEEPDYEEEALKVYSNNKDVLDCDYITFEEYYVELRKSGLTEEAAKQKSLVNFIKIEEPETEEKIEAEEEIEEPKYLVKEVEEVTMYVKSDIFTYSLPSIEGDELNALKKDESVQIIGYVDEYNDEDCLWYLLKDKTSDNKNQYVNGGYLLDKKVTDEKTAAAQQQPSAQQQPVVDQQQPVAEQQQEIYYGGNVEYDDEGGILIGDGDDFGVDYDEWAATQDWRPDPDDHLNLE